MHPMMYHTRTAEQALADLDARPDGLASPEAARRRAEVGPNALTAGRRISPWTLLAAQFRNVLVILLLIATALSAALGHGVEAVAITAIVLFAVLLGFVQEWRAERALDALRELSAPTAAVLRDGQERQVPARDVVPGDILLLRVGDRVAADARVLESVHLQVQEAALTGESLPVEKTEAALDDPALAPADRTNLVYAGTAVTYGRGRAVVVATGMRTEFGRIAQLLESVDAGKTPLQKDLERLGQVLARAALAVVAVIVALGLLRGQPFVEMLVFGIALAVAVVPEALPAVVTISLAIGVQRLARRNALIRRLPAVETLGSASVICSDKTGTLTRDQMTVRRLFAGGVDYEMRGAGYEPVGGLWRDGQEIAPPEPVLRLLHAAALASDARVAPGESDGRWAVQGDPTEGALVVAAAKAGLEKAELDARHPRVEEIPFTTESRRMTTLHTGVGEGLTAFVKGAPEVVLAACVRQAGAAGDLPLDDAGRDALHQRVHTLAAEGLRVLAVATRARTDRANAEDGLTLLGLVGMMDPPRPEAAAAIRTCVEAGIRVVMITGDHPLTAQAIARELGLARTEQVVTGAEMEDWSDDALAAALERTDTFARISPAHKLRVVAALQRRGHTVAMTGDGVNDAPALKQADIGVAMGIAGTAVAREAAALTLADDNFASLVAAVEEGRGVFGNIKKYLMYLLSSNVGEIGLMAGAALLGLPLPLTTVQLLYVNLATDGLPALALAVDPPERDLMRRPPRDPGEGIFSRPVATLILVGGLWSALVNLALFAGALRTGRTPADAGALTFVSLVLIQFCKAYSFRSDRHSALVRPWANRWLNAAVAWELALLAVAIYAPALQGAFRTHALSVAELALAVGAAGTVVPVLEIAKAALRRQGNGAGRRI